MLRTSNLQALRPFVPVPSSSRVTLLPHNTRSLRLVMVDSTTLISKNNTPALRRSQSTFSSNDSRPPSSRMKSLEKKAEQASVSVDKEHIKKVRRAQDDAEALRRFEERFGGSEAVALGDLVNGQPEGLGKHTKKNMFRVI